MKIACPIINSYGRGEYLSSASSPTQVGLLHRKSAPGAVLLRVGRGVGGLRSSRWSVAGFARGKRNSHLPCAWNTLTPGQGTKADRVSVSHPIPCNFDPKGQNFINAVK